MKQENLTPQDVNDVLNYANALDRHLPLLQVLTLRAVDLFADGGLIDIDGVCNPPAALLCMLDVYGLEEVARLVNIIQEAWHEYKHSNESEPVWHIKIAAMALDDELDRKPLATTLIGLLLQNVKQEAS